MKSFQLILEECLTALSNGMATVDECLARYPQHAGQLKPLLRGARFLKNGRKLSPSHAFKTHSRIYLVKHLHFNPRPFKQMRLSWRLTLTLAMLVSTFFVTGTVHAQSVLPGDNFYPWKRATEEIWRSISTNPVDVDIALSERRLNEWMAVADDPILNVVAMQSYFEELNRLKGMDNVDTHKFITPVIMSHQEILNNAGLPGTELVVNFLTLQLTPSPIATFTQIFFTRTVVFIPTFTPTPQPTSTLTPKPTATSTREPTATPTEEPTSTPTEEPTSTPTQEPTSTPTQEPTSTPTEEPPTATPTEEPPTATPTEPEPTATSIGPLATVFP